MFNWRPTALSCFMACLLGSSVATAAPGDESVIWKHERTGNVAATL